MSPPRAASGRTPLGRLVDALRRRLRPERGELPATVPGLGSGEETAVAAAERPAAESPAESGAADADTGAEREDSDARFDAARDRLRSTIEPPPPDDAD